MKAKSIKYEKLVNTGNFTHEKYGIELELEEGDTAKDAMAAAKEFIARQINSPSPEHRAIAEQVIEFDNTDTPF